MVRRVRKPRLEDEKQRWLEVSVVGPAVTATITVPKGLRTAAPYLLCSSDAVTSEPQASPDKWHF